MRLSTITNYAYGATVALTLASGAVMLMASSAEEKERAAVEQRAVFDQMTAALVEDAYRLTEQARAYVITGDPSHIIAYRREKAALRSVEQRITHLRDRGASISELAALQQGLHWADALTDEQEAAIDAAEKGDRETARAIVFGDEYGRELDRVSAQIGKFQYMLDQRTENTVRQATEAARQWRLMSEIMMGATALLFLCVLYFILKQRILRPVVRLSDVVTRLAAQDYAVVPPDFPQVDEIGDMAQAIRIFRENGLERQRLEQERDADRITRDQLSRMTQRLQGCDSTGGLVEVVRRFAPEIAPGFAGRLYIHDTRRNMMVQACDWLSPRQSGEEFPPTACWALRRGQIHKPAGDLVDIPCEHLAEGAEVRTICIPLTAQGESIGLLYVEQPEDRTADQIGRTEKYLEMLAENIGLALANLRLRDALQQMAMADPLTGLANRRRFDAVFKELVVRAESALTPLACLMVDIDHFKRFNDTHGHDAGDAVLRAVGGVLDDALREKDCAFRLGGEEFVLLMPGFAQDQAIDRAIQVQQKLQELRVEHRGEELGPITASFGLAVFPDHGKAETLVRTADAALLRAKNQGRNQIVIATVRDAASHPA
ncbi:diguanylate cyclase [Sphingobium indicum]|uniref:diguanylate cyclase n=1 Tax=Sphingobium indicum F2 TaxID=1450518 RepID=A0A8E1C4E5_9SPHN|nr:MULTISPECIES: diguanylate cyclase [Sphingobium]EQB04887.1 DeoR family transcriptional regulator [Sphingobium sp. HDIP04]KER36278.1 DeoR faimly transcriptional regulator [Sphingobium indicum F2]KER38272.1 DeoR faimly transcriptional regulator [Sphingobium indicum F2]